VTVLLVLAGMSGPRAARELRSLRPLEETSKIFRPVFESFASKHRVLFAPETEPSMLAFLDWVTQRVCDLLARERAFRTRFVATFESNETQLRDLHEEWETVDADVEDILQQRETKTGG